MKLEFNLPKLEFTMPEFKRPSNPLTHNGMKALAIVLGVIALISAVVYSANLTRRGEPTVLPATIVPTEIPTVAPLTEEEESLASPSATRKVQSEKAND